MTTELYYLAAVCGFTAVLWMPYAMNRILAGPGLVHEVGYPDQPTEMSPWATRLKKAHQNAIENLAVFAPLVLAVHVAGLSTSATALATTIYLWARMAHAATYTLGIPWLRTISFTVGFGCQGVLVYALLQV